jgi:hypothetical protein
MNRLRKIHECKFKKRIDRIEIKKRISIVNYNANMYFLRDRLDIIEEVKE